MKYIHPYSSIWEKFITKEKLSQEETAVLSCVLFLQFFKAAMNGCSPDEAIPPVDLPLYCTAVDEWKNEDIARFMDFNEFVMSAVWDCKRGERASEEALAKLVNHLNLFSTMVDGDGAEKIYLL